jgi:hypothetical protein
MPSRKTIVSIAILLALGLHAAPLALWSERGTLWPFMRWAMYKNSRPPGPIFTHQRRILALRASGAADTVTPHHLGLSITVLKLRYLGPMGRGDSAAAADLMHYLNDGGPADPVVELRVTGETYTVTDTGIARSDLPPLTYRPAPAAAP